MTQPHELEQHINFVRERLNGRGLSTIELRREARQLQNALSSPTADSLPQDVLVAELGLINSLIVASEPAPATVEQVAASSPMLLWQLGRNELADTVAAAKSELMANPESKNLAKALEVAEQKLTDYPATPMAVQAEATATLRGQADELNQRILNADHSTDAAAVAVLTTERDRLLSLARGEAPAEEFKPKADGEYLKPVETYADPIAIAEAAVAAAVAATKQQAQG
ncbi:MAG: hypothetical protein ACJAYC_002741 [Halieaceae bacterium]|jgi:hypothetical protein